MKESVGILHPGEMGISIAVCAQDSGHMVYWTSEGRSPETHQRANHYSLVDTGSLGELCRNCSIIVSVCPPHAAETVADQVLAHSFKGLYADLNAISPQRAMRIGAAMEASGVVFVDGGIIGGPAWESGKTWLYLSGSHTQRVADCFTLGRLKTEVIGVRVGQASALKMCYAAYTKGTTPLLSAVLAAAEGMEVREDLERQWSREESELIHQAEKRVRGVTAKAWRFMGEMEEIATTFTNVGLPGGFHQAAADVYRRLADFKGRTSKPELSEILAVLRSHAGDDRTG